MAKNKITTIKIENETKKRLDGLKEYGRETYNEILIKVLNIINITIRNPIAGARIFRGIKRKKLGKERMSYRPEMIKQSRSQRSFETQIIGRENLGESR